MAFTTTEMSAILNILMQHSNWDELSEKINYNVHLLNDKIMSEMTSAVCYDLECG